MVRWRWCVVFLVLLVPVRLSVKMDKLLDKRDASDDNSEENDDHGDENDKIDDDDDDDDDDNNDDDDDHHSRNKLERTSLTLKRTSASFDFSAGISSTTMVTSMIAPLLVKNVKKKPLECYVCNYSKNLSLQACLDPWKHRVHTVICQSLTERCYTWIVSKDGKHETVTRGCKTACVTTPETICCDFDRCNNLALTPPNLAPQVLEEEIKSKIRKNLAKRPIPPTIMFFVTVLLILQTVVKVPMI